MQCFFDIDTQLDFLFPAGALYAPGAERLIPTIAALNRFAAAKGHLLISTTCAHAETADEFKIWPPHCITGTAGQTKPASTLLEKRVVVPQTPTTVDASSARQIILEKNELDLFTNPNLVPLLNAFAVTECTVYGVLTEHCVRHAALGLLSTGRRVRLITDSILHLSEDAAAEMRAEFRANGGLEVISTAVLNS